MDDIGEGFYGWQMGVQRLEMKRQKGDKRGQKLDMEIGVSGKERRGV